MALSVLCSTSTLYMTKTHISQEEGQAQRKLREEPPPVVTTIPFEISVTEDQAAAQLRKPPPVVTSKSAPVEIDVTVPVEIPIVVICALRPDYLKEVLESLQEKNQLPNTPSWILDSPRYLFVHRHRKNDFDDAHKKVVSLAQQYNFTIHEFPGLQFPAQKMYSSNIR
jgi:hypothetical protein